MPWTLHAVDPHALVAVVQNMGNNASVQRYLYRHASLEPLRQWRANWGAVPEAAGKDLRNGLIEYGAGAHGNPLPVPVQAIAQILTHNGAVRAELSQLRDAQRGHDLQIVNFKADARAFAGPNGAHQVARILWSGLRLGRQIIAPGQALLYPVKCVLFLSGVPVAPDQRVRDSLGALGFQGVGHFSLPLPVWQNAAVPTRADFKKILALTYIAADFWHNQRQFRDAVRDHLPNACGDPGRALDALLFYLDKVNTNPATILGVNQGGGAWHNNVV
jgi:hypothetical protein